MPGLSKVVVLDPDVRASRQVQLGFAREGVPATIAQIPVDLARFELPADDAGLVVVGGEDGRALDLLRRTRLLLETHHIDAPIVFAGRGVRRTDAEVAGADEVVLRPVFLRDVVTIGRLLRGQPANQRTHLIGSLVETTGVYTLVRALAALGRSAVLTLIRGLRRGEIRFYHGEVTSAQVGLIHGQAALHQLLLWTEGRFDFHHEDVVRRQQIPMTREELFADAERFLEGVRDSSGQLSPSMVLEQDVPRVQTLGKQIPTEVHGVLRMFDGHRVLADVLEDSPYRVFETLRVAQRAVDVGLLRIVDSQRPKATWRAVLAIEEWLVGGNRDEVIARSAIDTGPVPKVEDVRVGRSSRRKRKRHRANTPLATPVTPVVTAKADIDWGALIPRVVGAEVGALSGVVPAAQASGEIQMPSRETPRERLEALDTGRRELIFPTDIGLEPKVVFDEQHEVSRLDRERAERARIEAAAKEVAAREHAEQARAAEQAEAKHREAMSVAAKHRSEEESRADAEDSKLRAEAAEWARAQAKARLQAEHDRAREAEELAHRLADAKARAETESRAKIEAELRIRAAAPEQIAGELIAKPVTTPAVQAAAEGTQPATRSISAAVTSGDRATDLAKQLATPSVIVEEMPVATGIEDTTTARSTADAGRPPPTPNDAQLESPAPVPAIDEPSDGVVRLSSTAETAPLARLPPIAELPIDDRPEAAKGEISTPRGKEPTVEPIHVEPSILITDLAAVQSAVAAVVNVQAAAAPSSDIASASRELVVAEVRKDAASGATAFSEAEEAFFRAGQEKATKPSIAAETFEDLDEGYRPQGFWDRLRGTPRARSGTDKPATTIPRATKPSAKGPNRPNKKR